MEFKKFLNERKQILQQLNISDLMMITCFITLSSI